MLAIELHSTDSSRMTFVPKRLILMPMIRGTADYRLSASRLGGYHFC